MSFKIYDPNRVNAVICGILITSGWGQGSMIKIKELAPRFVSVAGIGGDVTRSKKLDRRARIEITLLQASDQNALLSALSNLDSNADNGAGVGPSTIVDKGGTALFVGGKSYIVETPEVEFADTDKDRVWIIEIAEIERFDGSN